MLTKIDHRLWFTVFADFWMVCFFSTKRTVRVVTQKQFVSSIAHFNTFYFRGKFLKFWIFNFQTLALMCHFFVHTVVPVQGRSHEQKFRITIPTRTFGVTKTTLACQLRNGAGRARNNDAAVRDQMLHIFWCPARGWTTERKQTLSNYLSHAALSTAKVINAVKHELSWNCPARGSWTACFGVRDMIRIMI